LRVVTRKKILIIVLVLAVLGVVAFVNIRFTRTTGIEVTAEKVEKRDLEAIVSASGKIQPKRSVNISADTMGRVVNLAVNEGDRIKKDQYLLQIDPRNLRARVTSGEAGLAAARSQLQQFQAAVESTKAALKLASDTLKRQQDLWSRGLTTKEALDRAENDVKMREADLRAQTQQIETQQKRISQETATLESAQYDLSKVRIESPIDGIVTRRNIEEGEMVVIGTMNNPGTVLLTIADMSIIEAEVEVDETDIPSIALGQPAKIKIDAIPDKTFPGRVTEIGNSPIQTTSTAAAGQQATNFKVVVTADGEIPEVRPGFTCTAEITTATRQKALAVPIQAMAVREMVVDKDGKIVRETKTDEKRPRRRAAAEAAPNGSELPPGQSRKELEGVFVVRDGKAEFVPVKTGIAGDRHFEVLSGLAEGDQVITGPFANVRNLQDQGQVRIQSAPTARS
jgi:HlyD family secretion protein